MTKHEVDDFSFSLHPETYRPIGMLESMNLRSNLPEVRATFRIPVLVTVATRINGPLLRIPKRAYEQTANVTFANLDPYKEFDSSTETYVAKRNIVEEDGDNDLIMYSPSYNTDISCSRMFQVVAPYLDLSQCYGISVYPRLKASVRFIFSRSEIKDWKRISEGINKSLDSFTLSQ